MTALYNSKSASVMIEKEETEKDRLRKRYYEITPVKDARKYIVGIFDTEGKKPLLCH